MAGDAGLRNVANAPDADVTAGPPAKGRLSRDRDKVRASILSGLGWELVEKADKLRGLC